MNKRLFRKPKSISLTESVSSMAKEAERIVKNADKKYSGVGYTPFAPVAKTSYGTYLYTDGIMLLESYEDLGIADAQKDDRLEKRYLELKDKCTSEISLPELKELAGLIKGDKTFQKDAWQNGSMGYRSKKFSPDRTFYDFSTSGVSNRYTPDKIDQKETLPLVNADFLKRMLNALGSGIKCYINSGNPVTPLYFTSSEGEGMLMPIQRYGAPYRHDKWTKYESYDPSKAQLTIVKESKTRVVENADDSDWPWVWYDSELNRYVSLDYLRETFEYFMREVPEEAEEYGIDTFDDYMEYITDDMDTAPEAIGDTIEDDYRLKDRKWHPCQDAVKYGLINSFEELDKR